MKSKRSILGELTRDELADWASFYELEVADRRVRDDLLEALARSKKARLPEILIELSRDRLKEVCRGLGISDRGRAKATLVERLTGRTAEASEAPEGVDSDSASEPSLPDLGESRTRASSPPARRSAPAGSDPVGPVGTKMALRRFTLQATSGFRGRNAGVEFAQALIGCFGWTVEGAGLPDEILFGHEVSAVNGGKRDKRSVAAYWPERRVLVEVVERELLLDMAWKGLQVACLQMDAEPQYVVLTNQRDIRLYDLARDRTAPRLTISVDELPKYSEAFPFFATGWSPGALPKIINVDKVSKEVADLVAKVYRALVQKNPDRKVDAIRFTLQCIVAMFAEDIGLLPKEYFTTLLYQAAEEGDAMERIGALFKAMSTKQESRAGTAEADIPYFNGGLFTNPVSLALGATPLRALTKAAEANWTFVDPHIFGSVFQGIMGDAERHASGAHYTAREDIMSVVGPTIVEPWRERINAASTLEDFQKILVDFASYRVLDPACGSGNFLYVAFRELYKLETEVLCRIAEFPSMQSGKKLLSFASAIPTTNFFGIDINPFAVELAKTTLNIAKKIAFEERKATVQDLFAQASLQVDPSLPLDNLDANILCSDALFTEWPEADAIVGNPPFLGGQKVREELGSGYFARLKGKFPDIGGDLCAYWFRIAHDRLQTRGRAGLVATSGIRLGRARRSSLDYIVDTGTITDAVSSKPWPGDAVLNVSIVNWIKAGVEEHARLVVDGRLHVVRTIRPHLQLHADLSKAKPLRFNANDYSSMGVTFGSAEFQSSGLAKSFLTPVSSGTPMLTGKLSVDPAYAVCIEGSQTESEARSANAAGYQYLRRTLYPQIQSRATDGTSTKHYQRWVQTWWEPQEPRRAFRSLCRPLSRVVCCANPQSRPIFVFLSCKFVPTNTLQIFAFDDDYTFGVIQSSLHWAWTKAKGGRLKSDIRYTSAVWKTLPWPQAPTLENVIDAAQAAQQLRSTRDRLMAENGWSLRALYQAAEVEGPHPLKDAQAALDAAVEAVYGKPADQEATEFLLELNLALAEDEAAGETIQGPGLPLIDGEPLDPKDPRWFSTDCIEPPPLPTLDDVPSNQEEN